MQKKLLQNESGVALIMVMSALIILMALWGEFTFESKLSRIKTTNILDKSQARLVAESGLELAMVRLKLFKEAFNTWENNENAKNSVPLQLINQLWEVPFVYPIPEAPNAGAQVKAAIQQFQKESILEGELKVSIQNISNKLNLNMMRVSFLTQAPPQGGDAGGAGGGAPQGGGNYSDQQPDKDPNFGMDQQLVRFLTLRLRELSEESEDFRAKYGNVDPLQLVANIKYYVSDKNPRRQNVTQIDMLMDNSEQLFNEAKITPKYGPMNSFSEIYLIPGWDDELVNIIKDEFDVFPTVMIDLNKITANMLRLLIPSINENEIKEFFLFRDNPERPQFFTNKEDFKNYIVEIANILSSANFDELFNKYEAQGIQFGAAPSLFRVISEGKQNRSTSTIVATVSLPTQPIAVTRAGAQGGVDAGAQGATPGGAQAGATAGATGSAQTGGQGRQKQKTQLLDPRIIQYEIN